VDGGEVPAKKSIYHHYGLDFGGAEGLVEVGRRHRRPGGLGGTETLGGYEDTPVSPDTT
jgi:hypothetical protein